MGRKFLSCGLLALLIAFSGCAPVRSGYYTVAATKSGGQDLGTKYVLVKKDATSTVSKPVIILPTGVPRDYTAMQNILDENKGDILTNVRITNKYGLFFLLFVFGSNKVTVTADVWRVASKADIDAGVTTPLSALYQDGDIGYVRSGERTFRSGEESR